MSCSDDGETSETAMGGSGNVGASGSSNGGSDMPGNAGTGGTGGTGGNAGTDGTGVADEEVTFATDIWPILTASCSGASCHGDGSFLPRHASSDVSTAYEEAQPVAERIEGRVSGELTPIMPQMCGRAPGFGTCLSLAQVALIRAWIEQGAPP